MSKEALALEWISEYLGRPISLDDVGYESYVFEGDELDASLIPPNYVSYFKPDQQVLTCLYAYGDTMVYLLQPLRSELPAMTLMGLLDDYELIRYRLLNGGV